MERVLLRADALKSTKYNTCTTNSNAVEICKYLLNASVFVVDKIHTKRTYKSEYEKQKLLSNARVFGEVWWLYRT